MISFVYSILLISAVLGYSVSIVPKVYLFHLALAVSLFLFFINTLLKGKIEVKIKKIRRYLIFFLLWFLFILSSFIWADNKELAEKFILIYAMMFVFSFYLIFYNQSKEVFKKSLKILFCVFLVALAIGTLEAFTDFRLPVSPYAEIGKGEINFTNISEEDVTPEAMSDLETMPTSFFYNPNNYATFLIFSLPFILFAAGYVSSKKYKLLFIFVAILAFINIVSTSSNTNLIAFLVVFMGFFGISLLKRKSVKNTSKYFVFILGFLVVTGLIVSYNKNLQERLILVPEYVRPIITGTYLLDPNSSASISVRGVIMHKIINPGSSLLFLRGHGAGNTMNYLLEQNLPLEISNPHNWWLELLGDFGVVFLFFYIIFFISLLKGLWKKISRLNDFDSFVAASSFVSLLGFIIASMSPSSIAYFIPHWILISIAIITINLEREKIQ